MAQRKNNKRSNLMTLEQEEIKLTDSVIVGAYSVDSNGKFQNDMSAAKYLKKKYWKTPQDVNFDLKELGKNMEVTEIKPHNYLKKLNNLTKFIQENPENFIKNKRVDADFVCFRGVLKCILGSVYNYRGFILEAVKLEGTIYLAHKTLKEQPTEHFKYFNKCLLSSDPKDESATVKNDKLNIVKSRNINELNILFAAECDGLISEDIVDSLDDLEPSKIIEIKNRVDKPHHKIKAIGDFKIFNFWCQSFFASIDAIYLGKRDARDIVKKIEKINVKWPENSAKFLDKNVCLKRLREFLRHILVDMHGVDDPCAVFRYEWKERLKDEPENHFPVKPVQLNDEKFLSKDYVSFINDLNEIK